MTNRREVLASLASLPIAGVQAKQVPEPELSFEADMFHEFQPHTIYLQYALQVSPGEDTFEDVFLAVDDADSKSAAILRVVAFLRRLFRDGHCPEWDGPDEAGNLVPLLHEAKSVLDALEYNFRRRGNRSDARKFFDALAAVNRLISEFQETEKQYVDGRASQ